MTPQQDDVIEETVVTRTRRKATTPPKELADAATHVCLLIDESGSMRGVREATIKSVNGYLMDLRKQGANKFRVTLATFNTLGTRIRYADQSIEAVSLFTEDHYSPNYDTPLFDAMGDTIRTMEHSIRSSDAKVLFVLITDGMENASKRFTKEMVYALRDAKEAQGWTFVFLGADMDGWAASLVGQSLGFHAANTMTFDKRHTETVFRGLAESTGNYSVASETLRKSASQNFGGTVGSAGFNANTKKTPS